MNRRTFLHETALAGTVGLGLTGWHPRHALAESPPETTRIKLIEITGICIAPQYVAEDLLRSEGFRDVEYFKAAAGMETANAIAAAEADISLNFVAPFVMRIDAGGPLVILAGIHVGCFVLFAGEKVHTIRDLKGKTVGVQSLG